MTPDTIEPVVNSALQSFTSVIMFIVIAAGLWQVFKMLQNDLSVKIPEKLDIAHKSKLLSTTYDDIFMCSVGVGIFVKIDKPIRHNKNWVSRITIENMSTFDTRINILPSTFQWEDSYFEAKTDFDSLYIAVGESVSVIHTVKCSFKEVPEVLVELVDNMGEHQVLFIE